MPAESVHRRTRRAATILVPQSASCLSLAEAASSINLSRHDTSVVSRQKYFLSPQNFCQRFCRDKRRVLSRQTRDCRHKQVFIFVATKMILVTSPANDTCRLGLFTGPVAVTAVSVLPTVRSLTLSVLSTVRSLTLSVISTIRSLTVSILSTIRSLTLFTLIVSHSRYSVGSARTQRFVVQYLPHLSYCSPHSTDIHQQTQNK